MYILKSLLRMCLAKYSELTFSKLTFENVHLATGSSQKSALQSENEYTCMYIYSTQIYTRACTYIVLGRREKLYLAVEKEVVLSNSAVQRDVSRKKKCVWQRKKMLYCCVWRWCCVLQWGKMLNCRRKKTLNSCRKGKKNVEFM